MSQIRTKCLHIVYTFRYLCLHIVYTIKYTSFSVNVAVDWLDLLIHQAEVAVGVDDNNQVKVFIVTLCPSLNCNVSGGGTIDW